MKKLKTKKNIIENNIIEYHFDEFLFLIAY